MPKAKSKTKGIPSPHNYIYPGTEVLRNKYGERNLERFQEKCLRDVEKAKEVLRKEPVPEILDSAYLCHIHHLLFKETFEWAGQMRSAPFTFADGSIAAMPEMKSTEGNKAFVTDKEIPEHLQRLEKKLAEKNNLQDLTRKEFVAKASEMFISLKKIHPFIDGNEQTEEIFFENLAKAAGHRLDFSLVTKERMKHACTEAIQHGNPEPMQHIFEDISNIDKICMLEEFINNMKDLGRDVDNRSVMVAKENITYMGTYRGTNFNSVMIDAYGTYIISDKAHFTQEQMETLKPGDQITFTAPKDDTLENTLIPEQIIEPLTTSELHKRILANSHVSTAQEQVQNLSKIIYGNSKALNKHMEEMLENPDLSKHVAYQIEHSPGSIAPLAGVDFLCIKSQRRANAEDRLNLLCTAVMDYGQTVKQAKHLVTQQHKNEQERCAIKIEKPSRSLNKLLRLSPETQKEVLSQDFALYSELRNFVHSLELRLSGDDLRAIRQNAHATFAKNIGVSERKAQEVASIVQKAKTAHQQAYEYKIQRKNALAIAS
ncbi:BID domain-containing T4SS effector [Bartonella phoceensis]|uniref:BID domain-containing T4SS effector n=1 Tax=Bartonella phoceensis TaxID=270249 RepID=UPI001ABAC098|nr:BID domain-containing T4SS effector [Bartonella phoceensis]